VSLLDRLLVEAFVTSGGEWFGRKLLGPPGLEFPFVDQQVELALVDA
jgi:hypothetical protein